MKTEEILENIKKLEEPFLSIKKILETKECYKGLYKGMITIQSKIVYKPDILFIGINPGQGAYCELKNKSSKQEFPVRLISCTSNNNDLILDWLKKGNARGENKDNKWYGYEWYERKKKINNIFPARMIDLLFLIAKNKFGNDISKEKILTEIVPNIMYTNINPIATKSTNELNRIISLLSKENDLKKILRLGNKKKITKSDINAFFRQKSFDLVDIVKPKIIVCIGLEAQNKLTYIKIPKNNRVFTKQYTIRDKKYPLITFTRKGNWGGNVIKKVAEEIKEVEEEIENNLQ